MRLRPLRSVRTICFRNFSRDAYDPPLQTPLTRSPACFNHWIIFESLLLESCRVNPPKAIAPNAAAGLTADAGTRHDGSAWTSLRGAVGTRSRRVRLHWLQSIAIRRPAEYVDLLLVNLGPVKALCRGL